MSQSCDSLHALNSIPAGEMVDLAACPPSYRRTFAPRESMTPSPLTQPRVLADDDLEYEDPQAGPRTARLLGYGLLAELVAVVSVCLYVVLRHKY